MTLLDAPHYSNRLTRWIRILAMTSLVLLAMLIMNVLFPWTWPEKHHVNKFFAALEAGDLAKAYGQWNHDPDWQQHADRYKTYDFQHFQKDWGPLGDYGAIKSHQIILSAPYGHGAVLAVDINGGKTPVFLHVDRKTKEISYSPFEPYTGP